MFCVSTEGRVPRMPIPGLCGHPDAQAGAPAAIHVAGHIPKVCHVMQALRDTRSHPVELPLPPPDAINAPLEGQHG